MTSRSGVVSGRGGCDRSRRRVFCCVCGVLVRRARLDFLAGRCVGDTYRRDVCGRMQGLSGRDGSHLLRVVSSSSAHDSTVPRRQRGTHFSRPSNARLTAVNTRHTTAMQPRFMLHALLFAAAAALLAPAAPKRSLIQRHGIFDGVAVRAAFLSSVMFPRRAPRSFLTASRVVRRRAASAAIRLRT